MKMIHDGSLSSFVPCSYLRLRVDIGSIIHQLSDHVSLTSEWGYVQSRVSFLWAQKHELNVQMFNESTSGSKRVHYQGVFHFIRYGETSIILASYISGEKQMTRFMGQEFEITYWNLSWISIPSYSLNSEKDSVFHPNEFFALSLWGKCLSNPPVLFTKEDPIRTPLKNP